MWNIAYVTPSILTTYSAAIVNTMQMCNAFSKNGFNTVLCIPKFNKSWDFLVEHFGVEHGFKIIEINIPVPFLRGSVPGRTAIFSVLAAKRLRTINCDVIYSRNPWLFFIMCVLYKRHCFLESHQFRFSPPFQTCIYHFLVKQSMLSGNGSIVCISRTLKKQWQDYGVDSSKIFVAHDAVNIEQFSNNLSKNEARQELGIDLDKNIVLYTGSLIPGKGAHLLIKCANIVREVHFVIVGGTEDQIGLLSQLVKHGNVSFVGYVRPTRIPIYQAVADILALPNTKRSVIGDVTSPMKLFEYIASRRPIVATDIPSVLEILSDGHNALISPVSDEVKLSENIRLLLKNPSLRKQLVKNATRDLRKYSWDARVEYLSKLFQNVAHRGLT